MIQTNFRLCQAGRESPLGIQEEHLDKAKQEGLSANIYTYNLPKSANKIDSIIQLLNNKKIDIVIGPAYSEQLEKVLT